MSKAGALTIATLFSGGEGVGIGARAAGLRHLWGIEYDADIAAVAQENGFAVIVGDVCETDPQGLEHPDILHASPPCPSFSSAKVNRAETKRDVALGRAVARFLQGMRPQVFTLENVWAYRKSRSWHIIAKALGECDYMFEVTHRNAADVGVPQTRKRMWVRAVRGGLIPAMPLPEPWRGWYQAIEDLLPDLPDDEFAPWQLERMPDELRESVLLAQGAYGDTLVTRDAGEPANTVTANQNQASIKALLVTGQYSKPNDCPDRGPQVTPGGTPANTVTASNKYDWRAFLMSAGNSHEPTVCASNEPARTVVGSHPALGMRAFLVDGANARQDIPTVRGQDEPSYTVTASGDRAPARAAVGGRVVRLSPRCLARFQSFPDSYILPESKTLAARIIGNAVPPLQYQKIIEGLVR